MQFTRFFAVFVALAGGLCVAQLKIKIDKKEGLVEFEDAAIQLLTTCYADRDKTIVLVGDFPGDFIKRLSAQRGFSLVLVDDKRRARHNNGNLHTTKRLKLHKVHVVVTMSSYGEDRQFINKFKPYWYSTYTDTMAALLVLDWPLGSIYRMCDDELGKFLFFGNFHHTRYGFPTATLLCHDRKGGKVLYASNPFVNRAPEPWRPVDPGQVNNSNVHLFAREYPKHEGMCENLHFDKSSDVGGWPIVTVDGGTAQGENNGEKFTIPDLPTFKRLIIDKLMHRELNSFLSYVNASWTMEIRDIGAANFMFRLNSLYRTNRPLDNVGFLPYTYPHEQHCRLIVTQFRGNKSQLGKIASVIDNYSWAGMLIVYLITLMFFKFVRRQSLIEGTLNLLRLTCNVGFIGTAPDVASRIYLACLLAFVVTMQGIFTGNLASLLTHDRPVRQVNSIQDLAELGHKVYARSSELALFNDSIFEGRVIKNTLSFQYCIPYVIRDPSIACLIWDGIMQDIAEHNNLHVSTDCIWNTYATMFLPWNWFLAERMNYYLGILFGAGAIGSFSGIVAEKRLREIESQEIPEEPEVMTLHTFKFAFEILGIGMGISFVVFIVEIVVHKIHHRVTTTRVIVL